MAWDKTGRAVGLLWLLAAPLAAVHMNDAWAADMLPATGVVEVLAAGEIIGDGQTEALVHAVFRLPSGAPITGLKLKASTTSGTVSEVLEIAEGVYATRFVAAATTAPAVATVSFKGRHEALGAIEAKRDLAVSPPFRGRLAVSTGQPAIVLGQDTETTVSIAFPAGVEAPTSPADVLVRASSGTVSGVVPLGGGRFAARYTPPQANYPHLAMLTVVDRRAPSDVWGSAVLALQGRVDYPVTARPGANVVLKLGGREYGPVTADAAGRANIPLVVPPGVKVATQISADSSGVTEGTLDLQVPPTQRVAIFDPPPNVPADARAAVSIRVVVRKADGSPDVDSVPAMTVTAGKISEARHAGEGVYVATFTPPNGRSASTATVQASLADGSKGASLDIALVPGLPANVELTAEPSVLVEGSTALKVYATLQDGEGTGLSGRQLRVRAAGAAFKAVTDLKGGDYRAEFSADPGTSAIVQVAAVSAPSANALRYVVLLPYASSVPTGKAQVVTIVTADAFGYPVPNVAVDLVVSGVGGGLPAQVTTDGEGLADVVFEAGAAPGLVQIEAKSGVARGSTAFWAGDLEAAVFPPSGTEAARAVQFAWRAAVQRVSADRPGGAEPPLAQWATSVPSAGAVSPESLVSDAIPGAPTALALVPSGAALPLGGTLDLLVRVSDGTGAGVPGVMLEGFATGGAQVGAFEDVGGGSYKALITAPTTAVDLVKINVVADGGAAVAMIELPMGPAVAAVKPVKEAKPASEYEPHDRPWARLRAAFLVETYRYEQTPGTDPGGLLGQALGWGGERGGAPTPLGFEAGFRGFLPMAKWVGLDTSFRYSRYEVKSASFSNPAVDNLFAVRADVVGRVPIAVKRDEVSIGLRAGFRWDDFVTFRGCTDVGCSVTYEPLGIPGLDLGLELGAEFWHMYLLASGSAGLANASVPYAGNADLHLGWNIVKYFFVDLGFGYQYRKVDLQGAESGLIRGSLEDEQILGTVGVGVSF